MFVSDLLFFSCLLAIFVLLTLVYLNEHLLPDPLHHEVIKTKIDYLLRVNTTI
jgi:hypothetical protein